MPTNDDANKAAELRAYARGYQAGKKRKASQAAAEDLQRRQDAFTQRAFLAVLPFAMTEHGWGRTVEGKHTPYKTIDERVDFAWTVAKAAAKRSPK